MMNDRSLRIGKVRPLFFATILTCSTHLAAVDRPRRVVKVLEGSESKLKPEEMLTTVALLSESSFGYSLALREA